MSQKKALTVYLDHLIRRQSFRYVPKEEFPSSSLPSKRYKPDRDRELRYDDIKRDDWFSQVRKPDFQRETNAWTPEDCVEFLDTVVNGRIIPGIILWRNPDNKSIYVLDGAHRLSVIRAWMLDDWGDKAEDYYERKDPTMIREAANSVRALIREKMGSFDDFESAYQELQQIVGRGGAPMGEMPQKRFLQATFYSDVAVSHLTLPVQWEDGDYKSAEQSFLRINRSGQPLDPWEATLIEHRNSSYARSIMCIANGGETGHYWPESQDFNDELRQTIQGFSEKAARIYKQLFVPPFRLPITDLNVPFMIAPAYFQKHKYRHGSF